ncbi:MAG: AraC family transcriptional regulator [Alphaproteobacteria bacterium]|nr:AraC family transcriptional regulator [Alphaproteobacteria bacterium]MBU1516304.1 AraC family transcriptional regulator [Alphaproteobacteria bacterium]MBU2093144.1 AraC family transcriptional regulator [Alphaproteobacteria bacterium]MBU2151514.1 AraC family transcriptional regulator [Alphaproteobacteria bacterium]MBU2306484.1 AraC family transcriptional regulator [Alphaproteobacteria bacterium]
MDSVQKAIWFVEGHLGEDFALEDVAEVAGLSRHHMVRAFGQITGRSVMRYVRARRLSEAARGLAGGAPDILTVALEAGYGSHEAFTRAFREQFGVTPEQVRGQGCIGKLALVEPIKLDETRILNLAPPRQVDGPQLLLAGLAEHYYDGVMAGVPNQWQRFTPWIDNVPGQTNGRVAYGVVWNGDDERTTDYLAAVEVSSFAALPDELSRLRVPARRYIVWDHPGHISEIRSVWRTIWGEWAPNAGVKLADAPFFERYPERFDHVSGAGGFEVWLPLA